MLFEEVNKLKATVAAAETTPSPASDQSAMLNSKKEMVSELSLVVHQTLNDKARCRCNVVISGLPKPDEGDLIQTIWLAENHSLAYVNSIWM